MSGQHSGIWPSALMIPEIGVASYSSPGYHHHTPGANDIRVLE